jgi:hypothetical protein
MTKPKSKALLGLLSLPEPQEQSPPRPISDHLGRRQRRLNQRRIRETRHNLLPPYRQILKKNYKLLQY